MHGADRRRRPAPAAVRRRAARATCRRRRAAPAPMAGPRRTTTPTTGGAGRRATRATPRSMMSSDGNRDPLRFAPEHHQQARPRETRTTQRRSARGRGPRSPTPCSCSPPRRRAAAERVPFGLEAAGHLERLIVEARDERGSALADVRRLAAVVVVEEAHGVGADVGAARRSRHRRCSSGLFAEAVAVGVVRDRGRRAPTLTRVIWCGRARCRS